MIKLLLLLNIISAITFLVDKQAAIQKGWRVSEKILIVLAFFGPFGAFLAIWGFRHKIRKALFCYLVPLFIIGHLMLYFLF